MAARKHRLAPALRRWWRLFIAGARTAWRILKSAYLRFLAQRAPEAAAGMAYYAIFSLFPLLIFLVSLGSSVLRGEDVREHVARLVTQALPISQELVLENLGRVLEARGAMGTFAGLSLLWSSSGFFTTLARQINRAWPRALPRTWVETRLLAVGMVAGLAGLVVFWAGFTTTLLPRLGLPMWRSWIEGAPVLRRLVSLALAWVSPFLFSLFLYRLVPKTGVSWREALWGAALATVGWKTLTYALLWYLGSRWASYHVVYGSLASVVVLLFWLYLASVVMLLGAHVSAAVTRHQRGEEAPSQAP